MAWLPTQRLADKPAIKSIDDVSLALGELAAIETRRASLQSVLDAEIEHVKSQHSRLLELDLPSGKKTRFDDREKLLRTAVEEYAATHRSAILTGKTKSRKFPHGELAWKAQPQKIDFVDDENEKSVLAKLETRGLTKAIQQALEAISWFGAKIGLFVVYAPKLNKSGLLAAWKVKCVTDQQLEKAGLKIGGGEEKLSIKLNEYKADQAAA